jgi:hypothetical protein
MVSSLSISACKVSQKFFRLGQSSGSAQPLLGYRLIFFLQMHAWFSKLSNHLGINAVGGESLRNRFLKV